MTHEQWLAACPLTIFIKDNGISQTRLGSILGCSRQTVHSWVNGTVATSQPYLDLMEAKLGIDQKHMSKLMAKWREEAPGV